MSTHASITVQDGNKFKSVYLHWDGYPERALKMLQKHYNNQKLALELVNLGDISQLEAKIHPASNKTHSFDEPQKDVTIFYLRDRNDSVAKTKVFNSLKDVLKYNSQQYNYFFNGKEWEIIDKKTLSENSLDSLGAFKSFLQEADTSEPINRVHFDSKSYARAKTFLRGGDAVSETAIKAANKMGSEVVGVCDPKGSMSSYRYLIKVSSKSEPKEVMEVVKKHEKSGVYVFRYTSGATQSGDMFPLVKIDVKRKLIYFLTEAAWETDELNFETRGIKLDFIRLLDEYKF